jgi:hypothetical protein
MGAGMCLKERSLPRVVDLEFQIYQGLLRALLKGMALQVEDIVDLLTLKDNADPQDSEGFIQALELAEGATSIPNVSRISLLSACLLNSTV